MSDEERVLAKIAAANPVPETHSLGDQDRAEARRVLERVLGTPDSVRAVRPKDGRRPIRSDGWLAITLGVAAALAVVAVALVSLGGHTNSSPATAPGRQRLIDLISVLRRPQTKADREVERALPARGLAQWGEAPDLPLVRFATTTPWGQKLYFVPFKPLSPAQLAKLHSRYPRLAPLEGARFHEEMLELFASPGGFRGLGGAATAVEDGHEIAFEAAGRELAIGAGSTATRLIAVVPDGVAKVEVVVPRQPYLGQFGAPIYRHSLSTAVSVHNNIAAVQVNRDATAGLGPSTTGVAMIWYAPDGQVIKRIGDLAAANRVIPPPRPGPETPRSRAAERNPSTPNPVWVTPRSGGPHTDFIDHFRQLLNNSGYSFQLSGTSCSTILIINDVSSTAGRNAGKLRGRIWNNSVAQGGTWCPGTYHLSIAVASNRAPKHMGRPFGTATFTVHR